MVKDLEDQLELKTSEIDRLYEQISSILLINKSNDALSNKCESPNSKVCMYIQPVPYNTVLIQILSDVNFVDDQLLFYFQRSQLVLLMCCYACFKKFENSILVDNKLS